MKCEWNALSILPTFNFSEGHTTKPVGGSNSSKVSDEVRVLGCKILLLFSLTIFTLENQFQKIEVAR